MRTRQLLDFDNQLSKWMPDRKACNSVINQLKRHGCVEGRDFVVKERTGEYGVFLNYETVSGEGG